MALAQGGHAKAVHPLDWLVAAFRDHHAHSVAAFDHMPDSLSGHMSSSVGPGGFRTYCGFGVAGPCSVDTSPLAGIGAVDCVACLLMGHGSWGNVLAVHRNSGSCTAAGPWRGVGCSVVLDVTGSSSGVLLSSPSVNRVIVVGRLDGGWGIEEVRLDLGG